jgi:myo-inositol catabolism protein IolC
MTVSRPGRLQCASNILRLWPPCKGTNFWYQVVRPVFSSSWATSFLVKLSLQQSKTWLNDSFSSRTALMRVQRFAISTAVYKVYNWNQFIGPVFSSSCAPSLSVKLSLQQSKKWLNDSFSSRTAPMRVQRFAIASAVYKDNCLPSGCRASI